VLAALGLREARRRFPWLRPPARTRAAVALFGLVTAGYLSQSALFWRRVQHAETHVRARIGLWLRENTPEQARIAAEPIGYIGYYSRRRLLDEVGLVSPEMVPVNRAGDGWFAEMLRRSRPDYVVERPGYLIRNRTLNSSVSMFRTGADRAVFLATYEPVAVFGDPAVPRLFAHDYRFVIFRRRRGEAARAWSRLAARLAPEARETLYLRAFTGPVETPPLAVRPPDPPPS
jgi:hypothetical protein